MGMRKETSLCESLDILIVSIKLHMIINMVSKHTHLHIQWAVIECQNPVKLHLWKMPKERSSPCPLEGGVYWYIDGTHINNLKMSQFYECLEERDGIIRTTIIIIQRLSIYRMLTVCCKFDAPFSNLYNESPSCIILVPFYRWESSSLKVTWAAPFHIAGKCHNHGWQRRMSNTWPLQPIIFLVTYILKTRRHGTTCPMAQIPVNIWLLERMWQSYQEGVFRKTHGSNTDVAQGQWGPYCEHKLSSLW